ncbi:MAG: hypothetical protein ACE5FA_08250 [Dehalococcoidia bacterium]
MTTFEHRCPATDPSGREICHATQRWPAGGREAVACQSCGYVPGVPWQREMAGKMGVEVDEGEPEPDSSGEAEAEPPSIPSTASRARSAKRGRRG